MKKIIMLIICLLITGCSDYTELNKLSIVTAMAIDKTKDKYEVTLLIANSPKSNTTSKEGEAKTTVYKSTGKTISETIKKIDKKTPKQLYFSHVNVVVISEAIGKDGFFKIADWLIRYPQTRNRFYLMQINNDKASNVLKIISPLESFPSQSIATLVESNKNSKATGDSASYSNFIGRILEEGYEGIMQTIKINGNVKEGSKQKNIETAEPKTYLSLGPLAIYKNDKLIKTTTNKETEQIQIINNEAKELIYDLKYKDKTINIFSNNIKSKIKMKNAKKIDIYISGYGSINEINGHLDLEKNIKNIEKMWNKNLKKDLKKLINKTKNEYQSDIFGFGNMIYKKYPQKWKNIKNKKYLKQISVTIHTNLKINSAGSLVGTLKGDKK